METLQRELSKALSEIKKLKGRVDTLTDRTPLASDHGVLELTTSVAGPAGRTGVFADVFEVTDENILQLLSGVGGGGYFWKITGGSSQNWTIQRVRADGTVHDTPLYTGVKVANSHSTQVALNDWVIVGFVETSSTVSTLIPKILNAVWVNTS